jgi:hypothetical protein
LGIGRTLRQTLLIKGILKANTLLVFVWGIVGAFPVIDLNQIVVLCILHRRLLAIGKNVEVNWCLSLHLTRRELRGYRAIGVAMPFMVVTLAIHVPATTGATE